MGIEQVGSSTFEGVTVGKRLGPDSSRPLEEAVNRPGRVPVATDVQKIQQAVEKIAHPGVPSLEFSTDAETGRTVVRITDSVTGELVRQIPVEEMLELAKSLDRLQGLLFDTKA